MKFKRMILKRWQYAIFLSLLIVCTTDKICLAENEASELFALGQEAATQGDTIKAIDYYEKSIEVDPDFAPAYSALGIIYLDKNGNVDDIIWLFEQAAQLQPQNAENYTNMCRAYFQFQKPDWAEAACLKAISLDPNAGGAKMTLAWVYLMGKEQPADAIKYFKEIIAKVPNPKIYYGLGMAYARNNELGRALEVITILRGMGDEASASQLERIVRPLSLSQSSLARVQAPTKLSAVDTVSSQVVKTQHAKVPMPEPAVDPNAVPPGKIRIQLRARLPQAAPTDIVDQKSKAKAKVEEKDDGYSIDDYKPLTIRQRQERVRNMRGANTGRASGSGTVSTELRNAP